MKKIQLAVIFIIMLYAAAFADPKIYVAEQSWDFGHAPQNSTLKHAFIVKNIGIDTLKITRVKPG